MVKTLFKKAKQQSMLTHVLYKLTDEFWGQVKVAANAEESASASEELNGQARGMSSIVGELEVLVSGRGERSKRS